MLKHFDKPGGLPKSELQLAGLVVEETGVDAFGRGGTARRPPGAHPPGHDSSYRAQVGGGALADALDTHAGGVGARAPDAGGSARSAASC